MVETLRLGILSTASINNQAIISCAGRVPGLEVVAVASRNDERAEEYAEKHAIPHWFGSYEEMISSPDIDCVYISLPASMHAEWSVRAMEAGKHVLCEKPAAVNTAEMERVSRVAADTGMTWVEAFHNRYHPVVIKALEMLRDGDLGEILKVKADFNVMIPDITKVQHKPELGGGALLDLGCYPISFSRWIAGCNIATVQKASSVNSPITGVNLSVSASLLFNNGVESEIRSSMMYYLPEYAVVTGSKGKLIFAQYIHPVVEAGDIMVNVYILLKTQRRGFENIRVKSGTSYLHQLKSFCAIVRGEEKNLTGPAEALANTVILDAVADAAGIK